MGNAYKITEEWHIRQYCIMQLDKPISERSYTKAKLNGKEYEIVPCYDIPRGVAIVHPEPLAVKEIEFV